MYKNLYLKKGKEESLERFHPWIFSGAIHHIEGEPEEGEVVRVLTSEGDFIAVGIGKSVPLPSGCWIRGQSSGRSLLGRPPASGLRLAMRHRSGRT